MSVQKYVVTQDETGFTLLKNHILQNFCDAEALGLWVYLASLPPNWTFYKEQIRAHFKIGRERLNRILTTLCDHKLITITNKRDSQGRFVHMSLHVCNMHGFSIPAQPLQPTPVLDDEQKCAPYTGNPSTVNQSLETGIYKDIVKKKDNKKEVSFNNSATEVAHVIKDELFLLFWSFYPVKKNRIRAQQIWNRKNLDGMHKQIVDDISNRLANDSQWQQKQFIPHPSTYLHNELWNDELTHKSIQQQDTTRNGDAFSRVMAKYAGNQGVTYDQYGNTSNSLR